MKCRNCGTIIDSNQSYCHECGTKISISQQIDRVKVFGFQMHKKNRVRLLSSIVVLCITIFVYNYAKKLYWEHIMSDDYIMKHVQEMLDEVIEERGDKGNFNLVTEFDRRHLTKEYLNLLDSIQRNDPSKIPALVLRERWTTLRSDYQYRNGKVIEINNFCYDFPNLQEKEYQDRLKDTNPTYWLTYSVHTHYLDPDESIIQDVRMGLRYEEGDWKVHHIQLSWPKYNSYTDETIIIELINNNIIDINDLK